jgi:hypothetical protein
MIETQTAMVWTGAIAVGEASQDPGALTSFEARALVALIGVAGLIVGAVLTSLMGRWAEATARRRDAYAQAVGALVAWAEYPYRVRRRTSDSQEELSRLAERGHDLQERLRCHETWISGESVWVARIYHEVLVAISSRVGRWIAAAWDSEAVTDAGQMNLGDWGPGDVRADVLRIQSAISWRFGWRRGLSALRFLVPKRLAP